MKFFFHVILAAGLSIFIPMGACGGIYALSGHTPVFCGHNVGALVIVAFILGVCGALIALMKRVEKESQQEEPPSGGKNQ